MQTPKKIPDEPSSQIFWLKPNWLLKTQAWLVFFLLTK